MVANAGSRDVMKRFVSQVILFTCDVRDQLDHRLDEPAGALQSVLVMSAAASGMRAVGEELDLEVGAKYFGWLLTELKRLRDTPGVPGVRELGNLITYLEHAKTMNLLALFKIAGDRYKPDSELRRAFCPWKDAVEAAAPGSTKLFPVTVMYCPPATQGKR